MFLARFQILDFVQIYVAPKLLFDITNIVEFYIKYYNLNAFHICTLIPESFGMLLWCIFRSILNNATSDRQRFVYVHICEVRPQH